MNNLLIPLVYIMYYEVIIWAYLLLAKIVKRRQWRQQRKVGVPDEIYGEETG